VSLHHCHAIGCNVPTKPTKLMCLKHWLLVPKSVQHDVLRFYRLGQCDDKRPSLAWGIAATRARLAVAEKEGRRPAVALLSKILEIRTAKLRSEGLEI